MESWEEPVWRRMLGRLLCPVGMTCDGACAQNPQFAVTFGGVSKEACVSFRAWTAHSLALPGPWGTKTNSSGLVREHGGRHLPCTWTTWVWFPAPLRSLTPAGCDPNCLPHSETLGNGLKCSSRVHRAECGLMGADWACPEVSLLSCPCSAPRWPSSLLSTF